MNTFQDFANGHKLLDHQPYFNSFSASPAHSLKWSPKLCCSSQGLDHAPASSPQSHLSSNPSSSLPNSLKSQVAKPLWIPLLNTLICLSSRALQVILLAPSWCGISEKFLLTFHTKTHFKYPALLLKAFRQLQLHNLLGNYLFLCLSSILDSLSFMRAGTRSAFLTILFSKPHIELAITKALKSSQNVFLSRRRLLTYYCWLGEVWDI